MDRCKHANCAVKTDSESGYCSTHEALYRSTAPVPEAALPQIVAIDEGPPMRQELRLVAVQPSQMEAAQRQLVGWAEHRLVEETARRDDLDQNYQLALKNKWRTKTLLNQLNIAAKRVTAFEKILEALKRGYVIIPDFPLTIIAIRTGKELPRPNAQWIESVYAPRQPDEAAELLPAGSGRYVSPRPAVDVRTRRWTDSDSKDRVQTTSRSYAFQDVEFPFVLAKPAVLDATACAMANKIFDEIGVTPEAALYQERRMSHTGAWRQDPMIIGRIHVPIRKGLTQPLSFMVAWFLDESMLP